MLSPENDMGAPTPAEKRVVWLCLRLAELNHIMAHSGLPIADEPKPELDEENRLYEELEMLWPTIDWNRLRRIFA